MIPRVFLAALMAVALATNHPASSQDVPDSIAAANATIMESYERGNIVEATDLAVSTLARAEATLGAEHPDTLTSVDNLALLYQSMGRYAAAEVLYLRALEIYERTMGPEHPYTLASADNLAGVYQKMGRYTEAELLYRQTLEASERVMGPEHPDTLISLNNLATLYWALGRLGEAEPLFRRGLEISERVLGPEHPGTLFAVNGLAGLYLENGHYAEAEPLSRRALEVRERILGEQHPDTITSIDNLASLYESIGRYMEAEPLYRRALETRERVLGPEHPDTLASVSALARLYQARGRHAEAETLHRLALESSERVLGLEHPQTLTSVNELAHLYSATGRYAAAEPLYRRALETSERVLGLEHPATLIGVNNLAVLYESIGRYDEAEPLLKRAVEAISRVRGPEHVDTLVSINNLAALYESMGRYDEAGALYRRTLQTRERLLGVTNPQTLTSLNNLASLYTTTGRYSEAETLYRRSATERERVLGEEHPDTIATLGNLSVLLVRTGRAEEALQALRTIDVRLRRWLDIEVRGTSAAALRRRTLALNSNYQEESLSLALLFPSDEATMFAAELILTWKKRLAQDAALLANIVRDYSDPELLMAVAAVSDARRDLSNVAFDETVPAIEKTRLRETLEVAETKLRTRSDGYRQFLATKTASVGDVTSSLPAGAALVEYRLFRPYDYDEESFGARRLLAVIMRSRSAPALVDLGEVDVFFDLQSLAADDRRREAVSLDFAAILRGGYDRLINPLLPHLSGIDTLYIAPDGPLQAVPFEAFKDDNGRHLIQRFEVHMQQTGRDLVGRGHRLGGKGLVALGGIDFGETAVAVAAAPLQPPTEIRAALEATRAQFAGFPPLAATLAEVTYIGDAYGAYRPDEPAPILLTGSDATEAAVKSLALPPRVLHFATHGFYLASGTIEGRPLLQSGITLAGANQALSGATGTDDENGVLHAVEVQTLNLFGTELVVLSACATGQGVIDYSEGLEGLPRAFFVAGAQNVLAALWSVGDTAALNFMQRFYENWLAQEVSNPSAALRQTKLWYIGQTDARVADPQNWAPFVLFEG